MSLLDRFSTLLRADAHGVVDALEDRSLVLRQTLREAEAELGRKQARLETLEAEARDLEDDRRRLEEDESALDADTSLALSESRDDLARFAARRLLATRRALDEVGDRLAANQRQRDDLAERLADQEERFRELERRIRGELSRREAPERRGPATWEVADEEVELELLERRRAGGAGNAGAAKADKTERIAPPTIATGKAGAGKTRAGDADTQGGAS